MANTYLWILAIGLGIVNAYTGSDLPPGPYCGKSNILQCCDHRQDGCSHMILDTLCYCDEFCDRSPVNDDCCPDYQSVCLGATEPPLEPIIDPGCYHNGREYFRGQNTTIGCNNCICQFNEGRTNASWNCEQDQCIISDEVLQLRKLDPSATWYPEKYAQFANKKLKDGRIFKLGTLPLDAITLRMGPIYYSKFIDYPHEFDARKRWPGYITEVEDQGWCGADWAVALTGVASDRYAIQSNGAEQVVLSAQSLLSCNQKGQQGCAGGYIGNAWLFARSFGLVDKACLPYEAKRTACRFSKFSTLQQDGCSSRISQRTKRYQVGPPGRLTKERDIMYDMMVSGPVFAVMEVYQDFFHYRHGVYQHSRLGDQTLQGLHSVRVVGWGQEGANKYWVVANSWGAEWGERGYFRIARSRGRDEEDQTFLFVVSATAEVEVSQRK